MTWKVSGSRVQDLSGGRDRGRWRDDPSTADLLDKLRRRATRFLGLVPFWRWKAQFWRPGFRIPGLEAVLQRSDADLFHIGPLPYNASCTLAYVRQNFVAFPSSPPRARTWRRWQRQGLPVLYTAPPHRHVATLRPRPLHDDDRATAPTGTGSPFHRLAVISHGIDVKRRLAAIRIVFVDNTISTARSCCIWG